MVETVESCAEAMHCGKLLEGGLEHAEEDSPSPLAAFAHEPGSGNHGG